MDNNKKTAKNFTPIAIIGAGCIFPKAEGLKDYWQLLFHGIDGISDVPDTHWSPEDYFNPDPKTEDHTYCKRGGFLSPVSFDPSEFGLPPTSLEATDTSQILGLIAAKMTLEDSGYGENGKPFNRDKTSVILGVTGTQELVIPLGARLGFPKWRKALEESGIAPKKADEIINKISSSYVRWQENSFPGLLGNVVAGRICNRLDLGGTNCVVDAACASSMSAIHLSLMELSTGRSDMIITGGVDTLNDIFMHMCFSKTQALSRTGDARPFSKDADGTVLGEGVGLIVLKRLTEAIHDNDKIYAVIKSIGTSSDGKSQSIYAPCLEGQWKALQRAYAFADIDPSTVELIEAHGTGTKVGDITEFKALEKFFNDTNIKKAACALGSVKSNIGHTKSAAGAAGLIKSALSLYHKVLPPTLKANPPDPKLGIDNSPFYLNTEPRPWFPSSDHPRRSGVSAFGFGGSNFHIVLEEYSPRKSEPSWDGSVQILALSASTKEELIERMLEHKHFVDNAPAWKDITILSQQTRSTFNVKDDYRLLLVLEPLPDQQTYISVELPSLFLKVTERLETNSSDDNWSIPNAYFGGPESDGKIAFVFPGQGSQYVNMGKDLVCMFPEALDSISMMNERFKGHSPLKDIIFPVPTFIQKNKDPYEHVLKETDIAQPTIGAVSMAMLKTLTQFNVKADAMCGHSFGELTALYAAGWMDEETFCDLSIARGRAMAEISKNQAQSKGAMLAVRAAINDIANLIQKSRLDIVLANKNSPDQGVVSGPAESVSAFEQLCKQHNFRSVRLPVSAAFHSPMVNDAVEPFLKHLNQAKLHPTPTPVYSNTTGNLYPNDRQSIIKHLAEHILHPVDFIQEIENMFDSGLRTFVEIGPKPVLTGMVNAILNGHKGHAISLDPSSGKRSGISDLARALCHLAALGHFVELKNWESPYPEQKKQMMSIPISGANYRSTTNPKPKEKQTDSFSKTAQQNSMTNKTDTSMDKNSTNKPAFIVDALKTVQDALKTMQSLQIQTAETHKKFLEAQAENSRILKTLVENTREITEGTLGTRLKNIPERDSMHHAAPSIPTVVTSSDTPVINKPSPVPDHPSPVETPSQAPLNPDVEQILLDVVSQLTGYPIEMLGMDMDIEADLGIDSIKKVEILSTLEEKIEHLPQISPDMIGSLKTLGQISDYLSGSSKKPPTVQSIMSSSTLKGITDKTEKGFTVEGSTSDNETKNILLDVVCQLTGYPEEMLDLDMDLEADLGIDSIKKVEILSTLEENIPSRPQVSPDIIGSLKTLGQILHYLSSNESTVDISEPSENDAVFKPKIDHDRLKESAIAPADDTNKELSRKCISVIHEPIKEHALVSLPKEKKVFVTDDQSGLSQAIVNELNSKGIEATHISINNKNLDNLAESSSGLIIVQNPDGQLSDIEIKNIFLAVQTFAPHLNHTGKTENAVFSTVSRMDGAFGFEAKHFSNPEHGALAGLVKTASIEWESVLCRSIDVARDVTINSVIVKNIVNEILNGDPGAPVEIGVSHDSRMILNLESSPAPTGDIPVDEKDVFIVTGGARGITASCVYALASSVKPTLVLFGRSPQPFEEPEWLWSIDEPAQMKKAILDNEFHGQQVSPVQVETSFKKYMANREIKETISKCERAGSSVKYYPIDILNKNSVIHAVNEVKALFGPITGVIHGAGVLHDRLIADKTIDQFERVFDTKVVGFKNILDAIEDDGLKYLIVFSSIAARTGNKGQVDYAMANEVLNKIASREAARRKDCRVVSINWGPWDGGMVSSSLKKEFQKNDIALIPMGKGAETMLDEMRGATNSSVEVVIGASDIVQKDTEKTSRPHQKSPSPRSAQHDLSLTFKREIDVQNFPVLNSHILGGTPVVPLALISEWMGHGALHENPGLFLHGLDDMRILKGIRLDQDKKLIRLMAGKAKKRGSFYEVDVELRNGFKGDADIVHSKAKAILTDRISDPPEFPLHHHKNQKPFPMDMEEVYDKVLFHGTDLRGIKAIKSYSSQGMIAMVSSAPSPANWMTEPLRNKWIGDPLALDCAFQMATLWCYVEKGVVSLPSYSARYRQYRTSFPAGNITAVLDIIDTTDHKMKGNFTFLDADGSVIAGLEGYEAIMDASLYKSFKPQYATA